MLLHLIILLFLVPIFLFLPLSLMMILDSGFGLINGYYASLSLPYDSRSEKDLSFAVESKDLAIVFLS
jgi:hypothetical protein